MSEPAGAIYSQLSDDPRMLGLLEMFVAELPQFTGKIALAFSRGDSAEVARAAHGLKGAGGMHGFAVIADAASDLERAVQLTADAGELKPLVDRVINLCGRATASPRGRQ